ncbi:MAG: phage tail sheath subtilisin-like domain-containing protein [Oscillospiraceae bacterium]
MSNVTNHEKPGVYSVYEASAIINGAGGAKTVAAVALCDRGTAGTVYPILKLAEAETTFGKDSAMTELIRLLLQNGAAKVMAVPVAAESGYKAAFDAVAAVEEVSIVLCDSTTLTVQQGLRASVDAASQARRERIGVVYAGSGETVSNLVTRAAALNDERMVLVAPGGVTANGTPETSARVAAAVAGAIARESDPAVPLGGAELRGLSGVAGQYTDEEMDTLIRGGVTVVETVGGVTAVVRGITTRTTTLSAPDSTWRELSTVLIVDEVIPGIRNTLRRRFPRAKNTEQSRGAIRSQVVLELEDRVAREIITSYGDVSVTAKTNNPTVCLVEFSFTVAHGLSQIWLSAHITV